MIGLGAAVLGAVAVLLVAPRSGRAGSTQHGPDELRRDDRALLVRWRAPLALLALVAGWTVLGGWAGAVVGSFGAIWGWRALGSLEGPATVRRRRELERDLPTAVHLLGACLTAGSAVSTALTEVAHAMPGAVGVELQLVHRRLQWGVDPASVWRSIDGPLEPLGRSMARAHESGASVQQAVSRLATDLRSESQARVQARARTIEVRCAAPLGLCFLPAFVLLGVVPMAAGIFSTLSLFQ